MHYIPIRVLVVPRAYKVWREDLLNELLGEWAKHFGTVGTELLEASRGSVQGHFRVLEPSRRKLSELLYLVGGLDAKLTEKGRYRTYKVRTLQMNRNIALTDRWCLDAAIYEALDKLDDVLDLH